MSLTVGGRRRYYRGCMGFHDTALSQSPRGAFGRSARRISRARYATRPQYLIPILRAPDHVMLQIVDGKMIQPAVATATRSTDHETSLAP
jgi:hypothetical protein